jgi:hypothetical protein
VAGQAGFPDWERALFHMDSAPGQDEVPAIVGEYLEEVNDLISETFQARAEGEIS